MNLSEVPVKAAVRWAASGALSGAGEQRWTSPPAPKNAFRAPIAAAAAAGQGMIEWTMTVTDAAGATLETITENGAAAGALRGRLPDGHLVPDAQPR